MFPVVRPAGRAINGRIRGYPSNGPLGVADRRVMKGVAVIRAFSLLAWVAVRAGRVVLGNLARPLCTLRSRIMRPSGQGIKRQVGAAVASPCRWCLYPRGVFFLDVAAAAPRCQAPQALGCACAGSRFYVSPKYPGYAP